MKHLTDSSVTGLVSFVCDGLQLQNTDLRDHTFTEVRDDNKDVQKKCKDALDEKPSPRQRVPLGLVHGKRLLWMVSQRHGHLTTEDFFTVDDRAQWDEAPSEAHCFTVPWVGYHS